MEAQINLKHGHAGKKGEETIENLSIMARYVEKNNKSKS
jgi:hypothetical protein